MTGETCPDGSGFWSTFPLPEVYLSLNLLQVALLPLLLEDVSQGGPFFLLLCLSGVPDGGGR